MSLKYFAQKLGPAHYVLPRTGTMRVDAHAFFSETLFERTEESMWRQLASAASYPGVIGAYLMPDAHSGYGVPVGCVVVTEDTILQAGSGYDISCGVLYMRVPGLHAADVADWDRRARWIDAVEKRVATGIGSSRP
jgi:tRNA-splicing ligase RtcB